MCRRVNRSACIHGALFVLLASVVLSCGGCGQDSEMSCIVFWKRYLHFLEKMPEEPTEFRALRMRKNHRNEIFAAKCRVDPACRNAICAMTHSVDVYFVKNGDIDWERTRTRQGTLWDAKLGNDFPFSAHEVEKMPWWDLLDMQGVEVRRWQAHDVGHGVRYVYFLMPENSNNVYMYGFREH